MTAATPLDAALDYARRGLYVFPCKADKSPSTPHGFLDATCDPDGVRALWERHPGPSIGIATGASGLVVVDADCKNNAPGVFEFFDLCSDHAELCETTWSETPSGGLHAWFRTNGHKVANSAGRLAAGIDVRAEGGYILAPGSPGYKFYNDHGLDHLAPLPEVLVEKLAYTSARPTGPAQPVDETITEPGRDTALTSLAGSMRNRGMTEDEIYAAIAVVNAKRCQPPLDDKDLRRIAKSVSRYPAKDKPRDQLRDKPKVIGEQPAERWWDAEVDWATFWKADFSIADWVFENVLAEERSHAFYAEHKQKKSLFMLWVCAQVALTGEYEVWYIDYEMTEGDLWDRLSDMGYGPETDFSHFHYLFQPLLPALDTQEGVDELVRPLDEYPDRKHLLVLDTFSRAVKGEEQGADTYRDFYRYAGIALKRRRVTVARIDHAGKEAERGMRGSSAKGDDVDVILELKQTRNGGLALKNKGSRMSWVREYVEFDELDDVLGWRQAEALAPPGTGECVNLLRRCEVPLDATVATAKKMLTANKCGKRSDTVAAALKLRREQDARRHG